MTESRQRLQTLRAFATGLRAYLLSGADEDGARDLRRAVSLLAPLLEDRRRSVAAAANLWQACLRSRSSQPARALSTLDPALADPPADSMPHAYFARLLRCRLVASGGGAAAALALLMQMEERCNDWLTSERERDDATRAAQFIRLQVMADWYHQLPETDGNHLRRWCADRITELINERFAQNGDTVLRLTPVIPIIARPPAEHAGKQR